jgi:hypothetical protein
MTLSPSQTRFFLDGYEESSRVDLGAADRLARARKMAGYATAGSAAGYRRWNLNEYLEHEVGDRVITPEDASRYASGYRVSARWILVGA